MNEVSSEEFLALNKMLPEQRFEYALAQLVEKRYVWGLFGPEGWIMLKAEEDVCMPIWPSKEFATAWLKDDYPDCQPKKIELDEWLEKWLPGMQNNNTLVLVFPLGNDEEGIMLEAGEMLECIEEDLGAVSEDKKN